MNLVYAIQGRVVLGEPVGLIAGVHRLQQPQAECVTGTARIEPAGKHRQPFVAGGVVTVVVGKDRRRPGTLLNDV